MRAALVLIGFMFVGSAFAADVPAKRPAGKIVVASVDAKQVQATARSAKLSASREAKSAVQGDSRLNDYRLERDSCCGPQ